MSEAGEHDKSEQPTPFKLNRARQKGAVARGMDLGFLTGLAAFAGYAWIEGPALSAATGQAARRALIGSGDLVDGNGALLAASATLFAPLVKPLALLFATTLSVVLLFEIVQTGFVFSAQPLKPDFSKLNPANGLKRIFSLRLLIETFKNILKLALYTFVGFLVIRNVLSSDIATIGDGRTLSAVMTRGALRLLSAFVLGAAFFAIIDQLIVRKDFLKRMRMSRRELRREMRDREGEPRLKQKRKQLHGELAKASQSLRSLPKADVLITNPEHVALALRYEAASMQAPVVIASGVNRFAQRLKRLALVYGIPVIENRALARALYAKTALNAAIPEQFFKPVADIYNRLHLKERGADA